MILDIIWINYNLKIVYVLSFIYAKLTKFVNIILGTPFPLNGAINSSSFIKKFL